MPSTAARKVCSQVSLPLSYRVPNKNSAVCFRRSFPGPQTFRRDCDLWLCLCFVPLTPSSSLVGQRLVSFWTEPVKYISAPDLFNLLLDHALGPKANRFAGSDPIGPAVDVYTLNSIQGKKMAAHNARPELLQLSVFLLLCAGKKNNSAISCRCKRSSIIAI